MNRQSCMSKQARHADVTYNLLPVSVTPKKSGTFVPLFLILKTYHILTA